MSRKLYKVRYPSHTSHLFIFTPSLGRTGRIISYNTGHPCCLPFIHPTLMPLLRFSAGSALRRRLSNLSQQDVSRKGIRCRSNIPPSSTGAIAQLVKRRKRLEPWPVWTEMSRKPVIALGFSSFFGRVFDPGWVGVDLLLLRSLLVGAFCSVFSFFSSFLPSIFLQLSFSLWSLCHRLLESAPT